MTIKGGSSPACAACKYQRRKCSSQCVLAPYFPSNQHKMFQNVHRLYGVSKIMNLIKDMSNDEKEDAMTSIKYESDMRARFPVLGCLFIVSQLYRELHQAEHELKSVRAQLANYKNHFCNYQINEEDDPGGVLLQNNNNNNYFYEFNNNVPLGLDTTYYGLINNDNHHNNSPLEIQTQLANLNVFNNHQERETFHQGYDEDMFFNPLADDRQSFVQSKEVHESSSASSFRKTNEQSPTKGGLKCAAARFSLTSTKK